MNEIDDILTKLVKEDDTPSVQYIIFDKDTVIHRFNLGYADVKNKKENGENTTYNFYSITKTFTALAVMQLAEQKKLDIEQSVKNYLPDFPYSSEITIRQLLTHSAGIPNPIPLSWIHLTNEHQSFDRNSFLEKSFSTTKQNQSQTKNTPIQILDMFYSDNLLKKFLDYVTRITFEKILLNQLKLSKVNWILR